MKVQDKEDKCEQESSHDLSEIEKARIFVRNSHLLPLSRFD